jgi:hypothetical protein
MRTIGPEAEAAVGCGLLLQHPNQLAFTGTGRHEMSSSKNELLAVAEAIKMCRIVD